jgi:hypothetical protein
MSLAGWFVSGALRLRTRAYPHCRNSWSARHDRCVTRGVASPRPSRSLAFQILDCVIVLIRSMSGIKHLRTTFVENSAMSGIARSPVSHQASLRGSRAARVNDIGDPVAHEGCSLIGKEREQDFCLIPDDAHKCLRFSCLCPFYIGVPNNDSPDWDIFDGRLRLDDFGAIKINKEVLHRGYFCLSAIRPVALQASASAESVSAKAPLATSEATTINSNLRHCMRLPPCLSSTELKLVAEACNQGCHEDQDRKSEENLASGK